MSTQMRERTSEETQIPAWRNWIAVPPYVVLPVFVIIVLCAMIVNESGSRISSIPGIIGVGFAIAVILGMVLFSFLPQEARHWDSPRR